MPEPQPYSIQVLYWVENESTNTYFWKLALGALYSLVSEKRFPCMRDRDRYITKEINRLITKQEVGALYSHPISSLTTEAIHMDLKFVISMHKFPNEVELLYLIELYVTLYLYVLELKEVPQSYAH